MEGMKALIIPLRYFMEQEPYAWYVVVTNTTMLGLYREDPNRYLLRLITQQTTMKYSLEVLALNDALALLRNKKVEDITIVPAYFV